MNCSFCKLMCFLTYCVCKFPLAFFVIVTSRKKEIMVNLIRLHIPLLWLKDHNRCSRPSYLITRQSSMYFSQSLGQSFKCSDIEILYKIVDNNKWKLSSHCLLFVYIVGYRTWIMCSWHSFSPVICSSCLYKHL